MKRIYVAIDTTNIGKAIELVQELDGLVGGVKLGLEFFVSNGPDGVTKVMSRAQNLDLFLDLKFKDIPNTVEGALVSASFLRPKFINIHVDGGSKMATLAAKTIRRVCDTKILGVTVLTSMDDADLKEIGIENTVKDQVQLLTGIAIKSGLDGVVCSPVDVPSIRHKYPSLVLMTPGVRPKWSAVNDQKRVLTPKEALMAGSDYLVIGRPITNPTEEVGWSVTNAVKRIEQELYS